MSEDDARARINRWLRDQHAILGMEMGLGLDRLRQTFDDCGLGSSAHSAGPDFVAPPMALDAFTREWKPGDGDGRCQDCGLPYEPWFTDNALWNVVMGGTADGDDPGGCICPRCFTIRAAGDSGARVVWTLTPRETRT